MKKRDDLSGLIRTRYSFRDMEFFAVIGVGWEESERKGRSTEVAAGQFRRDLEVCGLNYRRIIQPLNGFLIWNNAYSFEGFAYVVITLAENYGQNRILLGRQYREGDRIEADIYEKIFPGCGWMKTDSFNAGTMNNAVTCFASAPHEYELCGSEDREENHLELEPVLVRTSNIMASRSFHGAMVRRDFIKYLKGFRLRERRPGGFVPDVLTGTEIHYSLTPTAEIGREPEEKTYRFLYTMIGRSSKQYSTDKIAHNIDDAMEAFYYEMECRCVRPSIDAIEIYRD